MSAELQVPPWTLGDHIRKARRLAGLTQVALGGLYGVSDKAVDNWEKDRNPPGDLPRLIGILAEHGVDPEFFSRVSAPVQPIGRSANPAAKSRYVTTPLSPVSHLNYAA